jgi:hypothetical protein
MPLEAHEEQQITWSHESRDQSALGPKPSTLPMWCRCCLWDLSTRSAITAIYKGERVTYLLFGIRIMIMWLRKDREQQPTRLSCWIFGLGSNPRTSMITKIPPIGHIVWQCPKTSTWIRTRYHSLVSLWANSSNHPSAPRRGDQRWPTKPTTLG